MDETKKRTKKSSSSATQGAAFSCDEPKAREMSATVGLRNLWNCTHSTMMLFFRVLVCIVAIVVIAGWVALYVTDNGAWGYPLTAVGLLFLSMYLAGCYRKLDPDRLATVWRYGDGNFGWSYGSEKMDETLQEEIEEKREKIRLAKNTLAIIGGLLLFGSIIYGLTTLATPDACNCVECARGRFCGR